MFFLMFVLVFATGCVVHAPSIETGTRRVYPVGNTVWVRIFNYCAPIVRAHATYSSIEVAFGESKSIPLYATFLNGEERREVTFTAMTKDEKLLGVYQEMFYPDYGSMVTRKQLVLGGQYRQIYDDRGRNACSMRGGAPGEV